MLVFWEFFQKAFKQSFIYRINFYISILSSLLFVFILMSVWQALFAHRQEVNGVTLEEVMTFVIITFTVIALVRSEVGNLLGSRVEDGSVSMDLLKPISFKTYMFANDLGRNLFAFMFQSLPVGLIAMLVWGLQFPDSLLVSSVFLLSLVFGLLLVFHINYIFGLTAFWFKTAFHVSWIQNAFWMLFAGVTVPMWFYPQLLYDLTYFFPFRYILFDPLQIYLGKVTVESAMQSILLPQIFWLLILILIEKFIWKTAQRKVTIHGG